MVGFNAVATWVSEADESEARSTRDVDILLQREDPESVTEALSAAGFTVKAARIGLHFFGFSVTVIVIGREGKVTSVLAFGLALSKAKGTWPWPDAQTV